MVFFTGISKFSTGSTGSTVISLRHQLKLNSRFNLIRQQPRVDIHTNQYLFNNNLSKKLDELTTKEDKVEKSITRMEKYISKSKFLTNLSEKPRFKPYFDDLKSSHPVPTITSFFILHELTAVIPLLLLSFSIYQYLKNSSNDTLTADTKEWILNKLPSKYKQTFDEKLESFNKKVGKYQYITHANEAVLSGVVAYGIVKILYPARILLSLYFAPSMGRSFVKLFRLFKFGKP